MNEKKQEQKIPLVLHEDAFRNRLIRFHDGRIINLPARNRAANEQLKYRDQLKDEFINVAAHELRTPIQPILGLAEYLQFTKAGTDDSNGSSSTPITLGQEELVLDVILRNSKR